MSPDGGSPVTHHEPLASPRRVGAVLAGVCLVASLAGCSLDLSTLQKDDDASADQPGSTTPAPAVLEIPSITVRQEVIELGIGPDGTLEVPDNGDDIGWYQPGGSLDGAHPTVFTGHVDTPAGPAVFERLPELRPGDEVRMTDTAGGLRTYTVRRVEDHPVDAYPTREVFGPVAEDEIRLITCSGEWNTARGRYEDNRVVYASASTGKAAP
jgi:sortase (surface protein transpeptidase)